MRTEKSLGYCVYSEIRTWIESYPKNGTGSDGHLCQNEHEIDKLNTRFFFKSLN
jgi:hypothetical protein